MKLKSGKPEQAILAKLQNLSITSSGHALAWTEQDAQELQAAIDTGVISRDTCLSVLDEKLTREGRDAHTMHLKNGDYADHCPGQLQLAYALHKGVITLKEAKCIRFDHGDTVTSFVRDAHVTDLPLQVLEKLLNHKNRHYPELPDSDCCTCC